MDAKLLVLAGVLALLVAGSAAADPIVIGLNCTAGATAGLLAVVQAFTANPAEVIPAAQAVADVVQDFVGLPVQSCVSGLPALPAIPPIP